MSRRATGPLVPIATESFLTLGYRLLDEVKSGDAAEILPALEEVLAATNDPKLRIHIEQWRKSVKR